MEIETSYPRRARIAISWEDNPNTEQPVPCLLVVPDTGTNDHSHIMLSRDGAEALRNMLTAMLNTWDCQRGSHTWVKASERHDPVCVKCGKEWE